MTPDQFTSRFSTTRSADAGVATHPLVNGGVRAGVYQLLAAFWEKEVDGALLNALRFGDLGDAYRAVGGVVPLDADVAATLDDLRYDYCRLFIGPQGHTPPVQSVQEEGRFEGTAAGSIRHYQAILGIEAAFDKSLPADHVTNLLGTFGALLTEFDDIGSLDGLDDMRELEAALFVGHVWWIEQFAKATAARHNRVLPRIDVGDRPVSG